MTPTELIQATRDIIRDITGKEFVRKIYAEALDPIGYSVGIEMRQYDPVWITAELPDKDFMEFLKKELMNAGYLKIEYMQAKRNTTLDRTIEKIDSAYRNPYETGENRK